MQIIPLNPVASQSFSVTLEGIPCRFWIRQLANGLYLDFYANGAAIRLGMICRNNVSFTGDKCAPLKGKLYFLDNWGNSDPNYQNLGTRFTLNYQD